MNLRETLEKHREFVGFVVVGGINTIVTWFIYVGLNELLPYAVSFTVTYAFGIVLSYSLNTRWVFRVPMSWKTFIRFPIVYVVQYLAGLVLLFLLVELAHVPKNLAPFAITAITLPATFLLSRVILRLKPAAVSPPNPERDV